MIIENVIAIDFGKYICMAQNGYGTINKTIELIVLSE